MMSKRTVFIRFFMRGLASLLGAGVPLIASLQCLEAQQTETWARELTQRIRFRVATGELLSQAFRREPKFFSKFVLSLIYFGERTGRLAKNLERTSDYLEQAFS